MKPSHIEALDIFIKTETDLPKIIVIYGPTACGKTALSIEIAKYLGSEIISADARQIYRHMDIGTGKIKPEEMQGIRHHMIDIIDPSDSFSVIDFREMAVPIIDRLWIEDKIPIVCGGSWLYIDSIIYERSYPQIETDWNLRNELEVYRIAHGNMALWERLHTIDPEYADTLHPNNHRYVVRGIEVYTKFGQSKGSIKDGNTLKYTTLFLTPYDGDRTGLYLRIDARVQEMFNSWLIEEVTYIASNLFAWMLWNCNNSPCPGLTSIGYTEIIDYLEWRTTLEEALRLVQQHNRNYAKRQITWNKKYEQY